MRSKVHDEQTIGLYYYSQIAPFAAARIREVGDMRSGVVETKEKEVQKVKEAGAPD